MFQLNSNRRHIKGNISQISKQHAYFLLNYQFGLIDYVQILYLYIYIIKHFLLESEQCSACIDFYHTKLINLRGCIVFNCRSLGGHV